MAEVFHLGDETHTLASALRPELEAATDDFVSCTHLHPLDKHIEVCAPDETTVRAALLRIKDRIRTARAEVVRPPRTR